MGRHTRPGDTRFVVKRALKEFAEAPDAYLTPSPKWRVVDTPRFFATVAAKWIGVCRLDFAPGEAADVLAEVRSLAPDVPTSWQTPREDLADALRAAGCRSPEPPLEPSFTALATDTPPPEAVGVDVRRIETFEEHMQGLEIELAASTFSDQSRAARLADAKDAFERRRVRPGGQWLAYLDGEPVAWGGAVAGPRGLYLSGGATLPAARGKGLYRALVRARWDYAVELGTPALAVGAQETSRPILERCGFERVCTMYELETDA